MIGTGHWEMAAFGLALPFAELAGALPFIIVLVIVAICRDRAPGRSLPGSSGCRA